MFKLLTLLTGPYLAVLSSDWLHLAELDCTGVHWGPAGRPRGPGGQVDPGDQVDPGGPGSPVGPGGQGGQDYQPR